MPVNRNEDYNSPVPLFAPHSFQRRQCYLLKEFTGRAPLYSICFPDYSKAKKIKAAFFTKGCNTFLANAASYWCFLVTFDIDVSLFVLNNENFTKLTLRNKEEKKQREKSTEEHVKGYL